MAFVRYGLPALMVLAGAVLWVARDFDRAGLETGLSLGGAALALLFLNWFYRIGVAGDHERDAEADARRFYAENGHWPDEPPPPGRRRPPAT